MRVFILLILLALPLKAQTLETFIQDTISSQIEAMQDGDFATAFTFASPGLRSMFVTSENFQTMVESGYPMVADPAQVDYTDLEMRGGAMVQTVQVVDQSGRIYQLKYDMIPVDDQWVINGVRILDSQILGV